LLPGRERSQLLTTPAPGRSRRAPGVLLSITAEASWRKQPAPLRATLSIDARRARLANRFCSCQVLRSAYSRKLEAVCLSAPGRVMAWHAARVQCSRGFRLFPFRGPCEAFVSASLFSRVAAQELCTVRPPRTPLDRV